MTSSRKHTFFRRGTPVLAATFGLALTGLALAQEGDSASQAATEINAVWNDPVFQKQFVAGFGVLSEYEPKISKEEQKVLQQALPLMAEQKEQALAVLQAAMKPESTALFDYIIGGIHFQQEQLELAHASYKRATDKWPSFRRAYRSLGQLSARMQKYDDAIAAFTKYIELGGSDAFSYGLMALACEGKQDYQAAEVAYRTALLLQPDNFQWRINLTRCALKQKKYEDSATLLEGMIERFPDKLDFWMLQTGAFINMKQPLKAAENLEALDHMGKATAENLNFLGDIYLNENLLENAANAYRRMLAKDEAGLAAALQDGTETDSLAGKLFARHLRAVDLLAARGGADIAQSMVTEVRRLWDGKLHPDNQRKLLKTEVRLIQHDDSRREQTIAVLEEIVKLDPLDGEALILLGQQYERKLEPDRALLQYERAANLEKHEPKAKLRMANLLLTRNKNDEALTLLTRVQELKPSDDLALYIESVKKRARAQASEKTAKSAKP